MISGKEKSPSHSPTLWTTAHREKERETIIDLIKTKKDKEESIQKITQFAIEKGGIKYAEEKMKEYKEEAMKKIEIIEKQYIKKSLEELIQHVIERKN